MRFQLLEMTLVVEGSSQRRRPVDIPRSDFLKQEGDTAFCWLVLLVLDSTILYPSLLLDTSVNMSTPNFTNPVKEDSHLRRLLADLEGVDSKRDFTRWKSSFVERFNEFLTTEGQLNAQKRRNDYQRHLTRLVKLVQQLEHHLRTGELSVENSTVKARKCLAEFMKSCTRVSDETNTLIPGTGENARELGYTKFHMGAVLIQDGFEEYDRLSLCSDVLRELRETTDLPVVADKQVLEEMENFVDKFGMFCDVMADLGLKKAMLQCHRLNELPDEPEPEPEESVESSDNNQRYIPDDISLPPPSPVKKPNKNDAEWSYKDGSEGRLEISVQLQGSGSLNGSAAEGNDGNPFNWKLDFPGIKPPSGPFIKYMSPEEYQAKKKEREEAARLKEETDKVAYKPAPRPDFKLGTHRHGHAEGANLTIVPDLGDYSSGTDSSSSSSSSSSSPKKQRKKKIVVKKIVKKKVRKKKPKNCDSDKAPGLLKQTPEPQTPRLIKPQAESSPESPPVKVINSRSVLDAPEIGDDDDLTLSPPQRIKPSLPRPSKVPPSALVVASDDEETDEGDDDEDVTISHYVDFDKMEGVKGMKKSNH